MKRSYRGMTAEARARETRSLMVSVGLHCHLRNLVNAIRAGDTSLLTEFQQSVQYAPPIMREELLVYLESVKNG